MRKTTARPQVFIGSSTESLDEAYAIQENLENDAEITVWKQGIFELSRGNLDSLLRAVSKSDFGVFVFSPTDTIRLRQKRYLTARDNVVLELGLFIGQLGQRRTFFVVPKGTEDLRIPTDLVGVTPGHYDAKREDRNLVAALGPFCNQVRKQIRRLRRVDRLRLLRRRSTSQVNAGPGGLVIHSARYGAGDKWFDVRRAVMLRLRSGTLSACVGNHLAGDPCKGVRKSLTVEYSYRRKRHTVMVPEGRELLLPEERLAGTAQEPAVLDERGERRGSARNR